MTEGLVIIGSCFPPALPLQDRDRGVREVFKGYPDIVAETFDSTPVQDTNYAFWENIVVANPDIVAGIGLCTFEGPTFAKLMPILNPDGIDFVTITADLIPETLDAMKAGYVDGAVGQHPYLQGYLPMYYLAKYALEGEPMPGGWVFLPAEAVSSENLEAILKRNSDKDAAVAWYADWLAANMDSLNIVPFD